MDITKQIEQIKKEIVEFEVDLYNESDYEEKEIIVGQIKQLANERDELIDKLKSVPMYRIGHNEGEPHQPRLIIKINDSFKHMMDMAKVGDVIGFCKNGEAGNGLSNWNEKYIQDQYRNIKPLFGDLL